MKVDPAEMIDANEVAALLGLAHRQAVSTYRHRYDDFPGPVVEKGRCLLWHRPDVLRWDAERKRRPAARSDSDNS